MPQCRRCSPTRRLTLATIYDAAAFMGPAYWIPAFWVPALLVTHYLTFVVLTERNARWSL